MSLLTQLCCMYIGTATTEKTDDIHVYSNFQTYMLDENPHYSGKKRR